MAAENFVALVERVRGSRSVREIAASADLPLHQIQYYMRPSTTIRQMPHDGRILSLARALDVKVSEVRDALARDIGGATENLPEDAQTRDLLRVWDALPAPFRRTLLQMARSLAHLERRVVSEEAPPELGDAGGRGAA